MLCSVVNRSPCFSETSGSVKSGVAYIQVVNGGDEKHA
jgi:hypothetical protein